jgi:hypothetical protein
VSGQSNIIIDYATARRREEPISTAITESTVQWLLHRRMNAQQQMRWSPRGAHLMLKVRIFVVNGTLSRDYAVAERWARRPFGERPDPPLFGRSPGASVSSAALAPPATDSGGSAVKSRRPFAAFSWSAY